NIPFVSDQTKQDRFMRLLFEVADTSSAPVEFIINFRLRDGDYEWQRELARSQLDPPQVSPLFVEFYKYFRDIGIYDGDGLDRLVTKTWTDRLALPYAPK